MIFVPSGENAGATRLMIGHLRYELRMKSTIARALVARTPGGPSLRMGFVLVALVSVMAVACQSSPPGGQPQTTTIGAINTPAASEARLTIAPANHSTKVNPSAGISVKVAGGTITNVTAQADGQAVAGERGAGGTSWHSRWALLTDTHYSVRATAVDVEGRSVTGRSSFTTLSPSNTFSTTIFEGAGKTYGVGMPIILTFSAPITDKRAVERSLEIWSSERVVGAWYWDGDQTLYFRPRDYWPANTTVRFVGHLDGVEGGKGLFGVHTLTQSFEIGRSLIAVAGTRTHHLEVYLDGKLFGDWPISTGKVGDDTPNGTYLTMDKTNPEEMIGPGYDILVPWSVRFTLSGDFIHDAFWSVNDQGFANVSHGCVNLSPANAETYYNLSVQGDPVTITGSPQAGRWGNGWTVWFLRWHELLEGSATHEAVRARPDGSSFVAPSTLRPSRAKSPLKTSHPGNANPSAP
jgi:lipoprotein-anchoring transpeptidase ErfK/SrfK